MIKYLYTYERLCTDRLIISSATSNKRKNLKLRVINEHNATYQNLELLNQSHDKTNILCGNDPIGQLI